MEERNILLKVTALVVGLDNSGKTSTIKGILNAPQKETGPTHGCVRTELRVDNFLVTLLDVGGGPEGRANWKEYYGETHGIIFVVDSSDDERIPEVKQLLADMLKQPRVARKPLLVLANKQDKMDALLTSDLIEALCLEKLVNQNRSLCHIEPCSALVDLRRWSDRKTLRGLRWLLRAVCLDYSDLCARVARDSRLPVGQDERERRGGKGEKSRTKPKEERVQSSSSETQNKSIREKEKNSQKRQDGKLQPIRNILKQENVLKMKPKKKKVKINDASENQKQLRGGTEEEEGVEGSEEEEDNGGEQKQKAQKEISASNLLSRTRGTKKPILKTGKKGTADLSEIPRNEEPNPKRGVGEKRKKKKTVKVKRKNKINTEGMPAAYSQPVDLSATFDLYRKAILALKARQDQEHSSR